MYINLLLTFQEIAQEIVFEVTCMTSSSCEKVNVQINLIKS